MPILLHKAINRRAPKGGIEAYRGGQFIPTELWQQERRKAADALPDLLDAFGDRLQFLRLMYEQNHALAVEGTTKVKLVPLTTIEAQMKSAVREAYQRAFLLGKRASGNLMSATEDEIAWVKKIRLDEFKYLRNFLGDIRTDGGVMSYETRADMYVMATRELYFLGWVLGNRDPKRRILWRRNPKKESCSDCLRFAEHGPYTFAEFMRDVLGKGFLPCSGRLKCLGYRCGCTLEDVT